MNKGRNEYTFFWFIENYSYCWQKNGKELLSPNFTVNKLQGTTWKVEVCPRGDDGKYKDHMSLYLNRNEEDDGPKKLFLKYELSIIAADGSAIRSVDCYYWFKRGFGHGSGGFVHRDELLQRKSEYLPHDILTVRCKMWQGEGEVLNIGQSSARTHIRIEKNSFLHVLENFSRLRPHEKQTIKIQSHSKKGRFILSSLYFKQEKIVIEIELSDTSQMLGKCELSLLDGSGNIIGCGEIDNRFDASGKTIHTTSLSLTREEVLNKKSEYLPDDKLSLVCECIFSPRTDFKTIEETLSDIPSVVLKQKNLYFPGQRICKAADNLSTYPSVSRDTNTPTKSDHAASENLPGFPSVSGDTNIPTKNDYTAAEKLPGFPSVSVDTNIPTKGDYTAAEKLSTYPSLSEDMRALYINQLLTDVELKTETQSFRAHKHVLCARSPVFKVMLTNDMKEKNTDCIRVDDIENDILQQFLLFLYSDDVEDLQWNTATQLYYAADKYQIGKLKEVCSSFLLENLTTTNVGELLLLSDTHNDSDLKKLVEDFILEHEEQVFGSKEWEKLMETNPVLVMKAMHLKYKRKREETN